MLSNEADFIQSALSAIQIAFPTTIEISSRVKLYHEYTCWLILFLRMVRSALVRLEVRIRQFVNLHVPGGSILRRGRPADLHLDYDKYADDEGNLYYVENNKSDRKDSG